MMTELDENHSTSVTNAVELIYQQLLDLQKIPASSQVIEHYPDTFYGGETFSRVIFDENGNPGWKGMSFSRILEVLECSQDEFDDYKKDERVQKEIYNTLNGIPVYM